MVQPCPGAAWSTSAAHRRANRELHLATERRRPWHRQFETMLTKASTSRKRPALRSGRHREPRSHMRFDVCFRTPPAVGPSHETLFPRRRHSSIQRPACCQVPANHDHISHLVAHDVHGGTVSHRPSRLRARVPVREPEWYAQELDGWALPQSVRLQVYVHHLASRDDVVEWVKGTS